MKIVFLCGCLEPGRDGVGDYTRRLSIALIRQGHEVSALAIKDNFVNIPSEENQTVENDCLQVLRIPLSVSLNERLSLTKKWIEKHNPDWLSLQFVPFSFHQKGLSFYLPRFLKDVGKGRSWHIMFHELWVGMNKEASLKLKIWGTLQKRLTRILISCTKPALMHTQTRLYQEQIRKLGYNVSYLPLFSNIVKITVANGECAAEKLPENKNIDFLIFGSIHPTKLLPSLITELSTYAFNNKSKISLTLLGRTGPEQAPWVKSFRDLGFEVTVLGEQPMEVISTALHKASIGISTTPLSLAEKSGSVAAMALHELLIICIADKWQVNGIKEIVAPTGIYVYEPGKLKQFLDYKKDIPLSFSISEVASMFEHDLLTTMKS